jgi:hypothetical protein
VESGPDAGSSGRRSMDDASTSSADDRSDWTGDRDLSFSYCHTDESASCSDASSSPGPGLGWPLGGRRDRPSPPASKMGSGRNNTFMWEEKREKRETELSGPNTTRNSSPSFLFFFFFFFLSGDAIVALPEVEMMKERFAKLLLGEDMSGGAKGVSTALAISNAITNLSGTRLTMCNFLQGNFFLFFSSHKIKFPHSIQTLPFSPPLQRHFLVSYGDWNRSLMNDVQGGVEKWSGSCPSATISLSLCRRGNPSPMGAAPRCELPLALNLVSWSVVEFS